MSEQVNINDASMRFGDAVAALWQDSLENKSKRAAPKYTVEEFFKPADINIGTVQSDGTVAIAHDSCIPPDLMSPYLDMVDLEGLPEYITPFMGYQRIAQLRQDVIYQNVIQTYAEEMTAHWLDVESGNEDKVPSDIVKELEYEARSVWKVDALLRDAWETYFGWDGGGLIFIDIKGHDTDEKLQTELIADAEHIGEGQLVAFRPVEAVNCQPMDYDTINPLSPDYFNPKFWRIIGKQVHRSRFLHFAQNKLPSMLKPVYNFFGVPWVQMLAPYREGFDRARLASLDSIDNHALTYFKTNLSKLLQTGCSDPASLYRRVRLFQHTRSNEGIAVIDKENEDFAQINTPLTDLADLVSLNLEIIAMVTRMPVTKIFGTPPKGMDATGDNYRFDRAEVVRGMQRAIFHENVVRMYELIQLHKWGQVYNPISYKWRSTMEQTPKEKLEAAEKQALIDQMYVQDSGPWGPVLHPEEVRTRLANDESGTYSSIALRDNASGNEYYDAEVDLTDEEGNPIDGAVDEGAENAAPVEDTTVQDTALNGAQVTALQGIVESVAAGALPKDAAKAMIQVAFPAVSPDAIASIINPIDTQAEDVGAAPVLPEPKAMNYAPASGRVQGAVE